MELSALQQAVGAAVAPGGAFRLTGSVLSTAMGDLFTLVLGAPTLELTGASTDATSSTPTVRGTLSSAPTASYPFLAGLAVTATFRLDASQTPQVTLAFSSHASGWGLPSVVSIAGAGLLGMFSWSASQIDFDS